MQIEMFVGGHAILLSNVNFLLESQKANDKFRTGQWYKRINTIKAYKIDGRKETVLCRGSISEPNKNPCSHGSLLIAGDR